MAYESCQNQLTSETDARDVNLAVALLRQSTQQNQGGSFETQYAMVKAFVEEKGFQLSRATVLEDTHDVSDGEPPKRYLGAFGERVSGNVDDDFRQGFKGLMNFIQRCKARRVKLGLVCFSDQSRFSRMPPMEATDQLKRLLDTGVRVGFAAERRLFDASNFTDFLYFVVQAHSNHQASVEASHSTIRRMLHMAQQGYWMGGNAPVGYELVKDPGADTRKTAKLTKVAKTGNPLHERVIPILFMMILEGMPLKRAARFASAQGLRTSPRKSNNNLGGIITTQVLKASILQNELYAGIYTYPRRGKQPYKQRGKDVPVARQVGEPVVVVLPELAYVTHDVFEAVQIKLSAAENERQARSSNNVVTGLLRCPVHHSNMYYDGVGDFRCRAATSPPCSTKPIPAEIEDQIVDAFLVLSCCRETVGELIEKYRDTRQDTMERVKALRSRIWDLDKKSRTLLTKFTDPSFGFTEKQLEIEARKLASQKRSLEEELEVAEAQLALSGDEILALGKTFLQSEMSEQNQILRRVFSGARFDPATGEVRIAGTRLIENLEVTVSKSLHLHLPPFITEPADEEEHDKGLQLLGAPSELLAGSLPAQVGWRSQLDIAHAKGVFEKLTVSHGHSYSAIKIVGQTPDGLERSTLHGIFRFHDRHGNLILKFAEGGDFKTLVAQEQARREKREAQREARYSRLHWRDDVKIGERGKGNQPAEKKPKAKEANSGDGEDLNSGSCGGGI